MTAPAARRPTPQDTPLLVFTAVVLVLMLCVPASREWLWDKFTDLTLNSLGWLGADIGSLTQ